MKHQEFNEKWGDIVKKEENGEEISIFVDLGKEPETFRQFHSLAYFDFIRETIKGRDYKKSLEVGCGRGTSSLYLNKYLGMDVSLVDISEDAIKLAKYNFDKFGVEGNIEVADSEKMSYEDASFDLTVSIGLAEHFKDYTQLFREQHRVLRPGGMMISLNIPKKTSVQNLNFINKFFRRIFLNDKLVKKDYFRNEDSPEDYKKAAQDAGFSKVHTVYVNDFPLFTPFSKKIERRMVDSYNKIYRKRKKNKKYPLRASKIIAASHFLIAEK